VLYFYLARALPVDGRADEEQTVFGHFIDGILLDNGSGRKRRTIEDYNPMDVLHEDIKQLGIVLRTMREHLLGIPWQLMEDDENFPSNLRLHPAHAAVVMRRIILNALTDPRLQTPLDVRLRNDVPRDPFLDPSGRDHKSASHTLSTAGTKQTADISKPETHNSRGKRERSPSARLSEKRQKLSDGSLKVERDLVDAGSEVASSSIQIALPDAESSSISETDAESQVRLIWKDATWYSVGPVKS